MLIVSAPSPPVPTISRHLPSTLTGLHTAYNTEELHMQTKSIRAMRRRGRIESYNREHHLIILTLIAFTMPAISSGFSPLDLRVVRIAPTTAGSHSDSISIQRLSVSSDVKSCLLISFDSKPFVGYGLIVDRESSAVEKRIAETEVKKHRVKRIFK